MIVRGSAELRSGGSGRGNGEGASGAKMRFLDIAAGACRPGRRQQDPPASRRQFSDQHSGFFRSSVSWTHWALRNILPRFVRSSCY